LAQVAKALIIVFHPPAAAISYRPLRNARGDIRRLALDCGEPIKRNAGEC
jgi:hypothetical protein